MIRWVAISLSVIELVALAHAEFLAHLFQRALWYDRGGSRRLAPRPPAGQQ